VPNKVKVFAWLYFKDRLSSRENLHAKHVVDDDKCQWCAKSIEDRHHIFFGCTSSSELWTTAGLDHVALLSDDEVWNADIPPSLEASLWPFVFLTILWKLWDSRNGEVFRAEISYHRVVLSRVCDDLFIWRKRLPHNLVNGLLGWRSYLLNCIAVNFRTLYKPGVFCALNGKGGETPPFLQKKKLSPLLNSKQNHMGLSHVKLHQIKGE
jgi:hypothetical protein